MAKTLSNINPNLNTNLMSEKAQGADVGDTGISGGQTYRWSGANWEPSGGGSSSSSSSSGNSSSWEDTVKRAIGLQKEAVQPAVDTYKSQIPQIQSNYAATKADVTAKEQTLKDRYDALLKTIGTQKTADVNAQTVVTSNELGKRGLLPSSTLAQQEVINATTPITDKYNNLQSTTELDRTAGLQDLASLITQLTTGESKDIMGINSAIAQLISGAGTQGITTGTNVYNTDQAKIAADAAASYKAQQDAIANKIAEGQLANQTAKTQYDINAPYFKPDSGSGITGIEDLIKELSNVGSSNNQVNSDWSIDTSTTKKTSSSNTGNGFVYNALQTVDPIVKLAQKYVTNPVGNTINSAVNTYSNWMKQLAAAGPSAKK